MLTKWHGIASLSLSIDSRGKGGVLFCKVEARALLAVPIAFWLFQYTFSKIRKNFGFSVGNFYELLLVINQAYAADYTDEIFRCAFWGRCLRQKVSQLSPRTNSKCTKRKHEGNSYIVMQVKCNDPNV